VAWRTHPALLENLQNTTRFSLDNTYKNTNENPIFEKPLLASVGFGALQRLGSGSAGNTQAARTDSPSGNGRIQVDASQPEVAPSQDHPGPSTAMKLAR